MIGNWIVIALLVLWLWKGIAFMTNEKEDAHFLFIFPCVIIPLLLLSMALAEMIN
jgi:heme O synthase-like polyprenyltransferase